MSSVDDETIMEVLTDSDAPRLTTTEIADELPLTRGTVRSRLQTLADEGRLDREREGRDVVWFLPERAGESSPSSGPESGSDDGHEVEDGAESGSDDGHEVEDDEEAESDPDDATGDEPDVETEIDDGGEEEKQGEKEEMTEPATRPVDEVPGGDEGDEGEPAAGSTAAVTGQDETVPTATDPASATATGSPVARTDDDTLVRAAIAGVLLAAVYYVVRRIRGGSGP